jgi:multidrug efflux pump
MRALIKFFLDNKTAVMIMVGAFVLMGGKAYIELPREAAPDLEIPVVLVTVPYFGVSPADIETLVTREVEKELKELRDLKVMRSTSAEGVAIITLEFNPDADIDEAVRKVREKVDLARPKLPKDAEDPVVQEVSFSDFPIITVALSAEYSMVMLKNVAERLQDRLEQIPGVLEVELTGGIEREVQVLVDPDRLAYHNTSIDEVLRAVQGENVNLPGGQVNAGPASFLVRVPGEFKTPAEIEDIVVKTRSLGQGLPHTSLRVRDVARVIDTYKERTTLSRLNQAKTVSLQITKRGGENLIMITDMVKEIMRRAKPLLPPGTKVSFLADQSKFIRSMVNDLQNNILTGLLLVLAVLPFFLTLRSSQIVASAIPLALLISFIAIQASGMTLNMIVLFSLILSLGMLVDNSIVVVENTYRLLSEGYSRGEAALEGAKQVAWPVIASTATTVAAFLPLIFWPGIMGKFMGFLPRTLIITLLASLFVALFINPVMAALLLKVSPKHKAEDTEPTGWLYQLYKKTLQFCLRQRALTMVGVFAVLIGTVGLYGSFGLGVEFFPDGTPDTVFVEARAADGTRLYATDEVLGQVEAVLDKSPHIKNYVTSVGFSPTGGGTAPHLGSIQVDFLDEEEREESSLVTIERLRPQILAIPGAKFEIRKQDMGPPAGAPVGVEIVGEDWDTLGKLTQQFVTKIRDIDGLVDLKDDFNLGRPEVQIRVDRERAKLVGTSTGQVAQAVRTAVNGTKATALRDGTEEYDVTVRLEEKRRASLDSLGELLVTGRNGNQVPLREVAEIVTSSGAGSIKHKDQDRVISLSANTEGRLPDEVRKDVEKALADLQLPDGYSWRMAGENEEQEAAQKFLGNAFLLAALMILMIIVLQFNSLTTPLIIMTSVLLSTIGVLWGLIVFQKPFGVIMTGLGVISLAGVAVNNAIVLIDFIRAELAKAPEENDATLVDAIVRAGVIRLRPVLLTAITTVLGLMPMVFGVTIDFVHQRISIGGRSAEMWSGMAIAVSFGLIFTTFLTLVVVPVLVHMAEKNRRWFSKTFGRFFDDDDNGRGEGGERTSAAVATDAKPG